MICITIAQESRSLILADMLNAAQMGADLLEIRLDCLDKAPQFSEMLAAKRKPILFSCRRSQDGGNWQGTEEERIMLLRQAIMSKADYVEIEYDIADQIRPFPGCQRVISYTNLNKTPSAIGEIYADMLTMQPDVIKLTCRARTPEEAWPLVQILGKPQVPTVVVGLGRPGVMLAVLGRKIGAPWTSAALERGMEAFPGQPTVQDLDQIYHYRDIGKPTRFFGITGLSEREYLATGLMNTAFKELGLPHRVLPLQLGNVKLFRKVIDAVRLQGAMLDDTAYEQMHELAALDESAKVPVQAADLIRPVDGGWSASNLFGIAATLTLEAAIRERDESLEQPLKGRVVMLVGASATSRMLAPHLKERGAVLVFASKERSEALRYSQLFGGRQVAWEAIYSTLHDVLIVSRDGHSVEEESDGGADELPIHPGYLRSSMTVMDLTSCPRLSRFAREAESRRCQIVDPRELLIQHVSTHVEAVAGIRPNAAILRTKLQDWLPEETDESDV